LIAKLILLLPAPFSHVLTGGGSIINVVEKSKQKPKASSNPAAISGE
jgi:hypothetical protein